MNDSIAIVFNPGRVYYDFRISSMQDLLVDWNEERNGELFSSKNVVYFVEGDFRLQISPSGQIRAFVKQTNEVSNSVKQLLEWSIPKALGIFKQNNLPFSIDQLNVMWYCLPRDRVKSEVFMGLCIKRVLGSNIEFNTLQLSAGNFMTVITGASMGIERHDEEIIESQRKSLHCH